MPRYWGVWTRSKLELLRRYLDAFTTTTKNKSPERIYLDLFGGQPENADRLTKETLEGSAVIALQTDSPPFTRLRFFEMEPKASQLRTTLTASFPNRDLEVTAGNCNQTIKPVLAALTSWNWAPTFAFIDPNGPDAHWTTLEALARFKKAGRKKTELWYLFADGMFIRMLPRTGAPRAQDIERITRMYGTDQWTLIYEAKTRGEITATQAREEYVNLMRWRLETVLGYRWTHPLEVFNEWNTSIYHMIFATDHPTGTKIMSDLYARAAEEFPAMRRAARQHRQRLEHGVLSLFDDEDDALRAPVRSGERFYAYVPPSEPRGTISL